MSSHSEIWTIGVEEEYQIIDPLTRALCAQAEKVLTLAPTTHTTVHTEMQRSQIEIATPICHTLSEVRNSLVYARRDVIKAAAATQCSIAAAGTHPFSHWKEQQITPSPRYHMMAERYQQLAHEQVIFGCHVHIGCKDQEYAIQIMNRARLWLAPILALTANSPFWLGADTGYASFRTEIWWRWPMAGPPGHFLSFTEYKELVNRLVAAGSIQDTTHIYWDLRLSERFPTMEFRIMDVCMTIDETVMVTGLIRALVQTCYEQVKQNTANLIVPIELLRSAHWYAARYGLDNELIDIYANHLVPASRLIRTFLAMLRPALESNGEWEEVSSLVEATLQHGTGAVRQREIYQRSGRIEDVVDFTVKETAKGC